MALRRCLHQIIVSHEYSRNISLQQHKFWKRHFSKIEGKNASAPTSRYSHRQRILLRFSFISLYIISGGTILFAWNFKKYYADPRKELFEKDPKYSLDTKTRDKMIKDMANKFDENMQFITDKNESINGLDVLSNGKFFILYFGVPNCNDKCLHILQTIEASLKCKKLQKLKDFLCVLYIDINIYDSVEKLNEFLTETLDASDVNIIGLKPKNMETLKELMNAFSVYIYKCDGDGTNLVLDHSNIIYFVDKDGLLYEILGGDDEINEENIIERTYNLLYHSESTFMGKLRNTLSLTFQTVTMRQMPDRHVKSQQVPDQLNDGQSI